ncbi:MAG: hypothetical protein R3250_10360, partial [Melioribacteraceae bacterium]|nr:hypothetical protein [Melioribacteraceae bacterium]
TDDGEFYQCTTREAGTYVPDFPGIQCEYEVTDFSFATTYVCEGVVTNENDLDSKCTKTSGIIDSFLDSGRRTLIVEAGDSVYIDTDKVFGDSTVKARYPSYGLEVTQATGFREITTTNCELNSVNEVELHTIGANNQKLVQPTIPFNVVSASFQAKSSQIVSLDEVENGQTIFITRAGFYNKVRTADDGFKYVDTRQEFRNSAIECIPRTTGCSDEAKIVPLEKQSCDAFSGAIVNYAPVEGDSTKMCKYTCSEGSLSVSNDCISIPTSCPADKPLFDSRSGQCTSQAVEDEEPETDFLPLMLLGVGVLGTLMLRKKATEDMRG